MAAQPAQPACTTAFAASPTIATGTSTKPTGAAAATARPRPTATAFLSASAVTSSILPISTGNPWYKLPGLLLLQRRALVWSERRRRHAASRVPDERNISRPADLEGWLQGSSSASQTRRPRVQTWARREAILGQEDYQDVHDRSLRRIV